MKSEDGQKLQLKAYVASAGFVTKQLFLPNQIKICYFWFLVSGNDNIYLMVYNSEVQILL